MKRIVYALIFTLASFSPIPDSSNLREVFLAAESYFLFEEFEEALPLYLRIHRHSPDNDNVNYKIGVCYLNNPYEKDKSIFYLEKAVKNISPKYKDNNFKETSAPLEAIFYLGNAYRINNEFEKSRESYQKFLSQLDLKIFDEELVKEQLASLDVAEELISKPLDLDYEILGDQINSRFSDIRAVISGNENRMVYVSQLQFYDAVFYTEKIGGEWAYPRNIIPELGVDGDVYPTCLSWDGTELYIYRNDDFIGNIYLSRLVQGKWGHLEKLNDNINTRYWESHASVSKDGQKLYFTSNRKDGYGGLDIYVSERVPGNDWGPAVNLGPVINTKYNEETPFISEDGKKLFFSSYGHRNMGGYDVFISKLNEDNTWSVPVNIGYPVNTTDDDLFFYPYRNGEFALYPRFKTDGFGRHDIYNYQVYNDEFPRKYLITGYLDFSGIEIDSSDVQISLTDINSGKTIQKFHPGKDGSFSFKVPAGSYDIKISSNAFEDHSQRLVVSRDTPHSGMTIPQKIALVPRPPVLTPEELDRMLTIRDTLIVVDSDKTTRIRFNAERGSTVIIDVYNDSVLIATDTIESARRREVFEFKPGHGTNIVEFTVTDKYGNTATKKAEVIYEKPLPASEKKKESELIDDETVTVGREKKEMEILDDKPDEPISYLPADDALNAYIIRLQTNADGNLKKFLENLDLTKEGIETREELISFLRKEAAGNQYSWEDINRMIERTTGTYDIDKFLQNLARVSQGELEQTLLGFSPVEKGITTPYELISHLHDNSEGYGYRGTDLIRSLGKLASGEKDDVSLFLQELRDQSDGTFRKYLRTIDPGILRLESPDDLAEYIYNEAEKQGIDKKEFAMLLTDMSILQQLDGFRNDLAGLADEDLRKVLKELDFSKHGIKSSSDLIRYLYDNAGILNYTSGDVDKLLALMAEKNEREIENILNQISMVTSGPLKKFISEIDLKDQSFGSKDELLNFLYANTDKGNYTKDDLNFALLRLAYDGDLTDIADKLGKIAQGGLKEAIHDMDTQKEDIRDFGDIVRYLLDNTQKYKYTRDDVYELLKKYLSVTEADLLLKKLIRLSEGDMNIFLSDIDLVEMKIYSRQDLISYLLKSAGEGAINKEEILRLILKADVTEAEKISSDLKTMIGKDLQKLIENAEKDGSLKTADQLFDYLLKNVTSLPGYSRTDILDLFTDYLQNDEIRLFIRKLAENAEGKLKEALLNIDVNKENIKNTGDVINYLLSKADHYGYSDIDIFKLIQSVLGEENLQEFIHQLIPFTQGNLRMFLEKLNLKETGIRSIEQLLDYLMKMSAENNYSPSDFFDGIMRMILSGKEIYSHEIIPDKSGQQKIFTQNLILTAGIFALLGLIILFFIWFERRKKKRTDQKD